MPRPLRILIAPDAFKECMTARRAAEAMERGVKRAGEVLGKTVEAIFIPVSDGGAGFIDAIRDTGDALQHLEVTGPMGDPVVAPLLLQGGGGLHGARPRAFLEMSPAAGLALVPADRRDPERTTTYGAGELILAALNARATHISIGIGNSATNDAGAGALAALGVRFFDADGTLIDRPRGADLSRIARIDASGVDPRLRKTEIVIANDVDNPLFGPRGAAHTFAPQKGATPRQVERLDEGLRTFAHRCREAGAQADPEAPGMGAAGGFAFGLGAFCGARLYPGARLVLELLHFDDVFHASPIALCLTGAGRLDATDLRGKAPLEVARVASVKKTPVVALVGSTGPGWESLSKDNGGLFDAVHVITPPDMPREEALRRGSELLEACAERVVREWLQSRGAARA